MTVQDQLAEIEKQQQELEKKKAKLLKDQHDTAYAKLEAALKAVNALGYSYKITGGSKATTTRRSGVRLEVLQLIQNSDNGVSPTAIAQSLGIEDKAGKQSINNALSALKKAGKVTATNGLYTSS